MGKVTKKAKIARFFNKHPAATIREAATATNASYAAIDLRFGEANVAC